VDVVSLSFLIHECPESAARALMAEAARILAPGAGGVLRTNKHSTDVESAPSFSSARLYDYSPKGKPR